MSRKELIAIIIILGLLICLLGYTKPIQIKPSHILRFKPVSKSSSPEDIIAAQAELCRHGIDVDIDGKFGKCTAIGICELIYRIENGYEVHNYTELRRDYGTLHKEQ